MNPKDQTSSNGHSYGFLRKLFKRSETQNTYVNSSAYIQHKKINSVGRQGLKYTTFFTQNNKREILQAKRRLRSSR